MTSYWKDMYTGKVLAFDPPDMSDTDVTNVVCQNAQLLHPGSVATAVKYHIGAMPITKELGVSKPGSWGVNLDIVGKPGTPPWTPVMLEPITIYEAMSIGMSQHPPTISFGDGGIDFKPSKDFVIPGKTYSIPGLKTQQHMTKKASLKTGLSLTPFSLEKDGKWGDIKILPDFDDKPHHYYMTPAPKPPVLDMANGQYTIVAIDYDVGNQQLHVKAMKGHVTAQFSVSSALMGTSQEPKIGQVVTIEEKSAKYEYSGPSVFKQKNSDLWNGMIVFDLGGSSKYNGDWSYISTWPLVEAIRDKMLGFYDSTRVRITAHRINSPAPVKVMFIGTVRYANEWLEEFRTKYGQH